MVSTENFSMDEEGEPLYSNLSVSSSPHNRKFRLASNSSAHSTELNSSIVSNSDVPGNITPNYLKPRTLFASDSGNLDGESDNLEEEEEVVEAWSDDSFSEFEESQDSDSSHKSEEITPIKGLNAFELLARRTGDAVSSMLSKKSASSDTPDGPKQQQSLTCFHSNLQAKELLIVLERSCRRMDGDRYRIRLKVYDNRYLIKLRIYSKKAALCVNIQLKEVQGSRIVECTRTKGTVQFYRDWYRDFQQSFDSDDSQSPKT